MFDLCITRLGVNAASRQEPQAVQPGSTCKYLKMQNKSRDKFEPGTTEAQFRTTRPYRAAKDGEKHRNCKTKFLSAGGRRLDRMPKSTT